MRNRILKKFVAIILLILSPLPLVAVFGIVYITVKMISGMPFYDSANAFTAFLRGLTPYFPYITTIPVVFVLLAIVLRSRGRLIQLFKGDRS